MRYSRVAIAIVALPLLAVACDRAPTGPEAPATIRRELDPPPPTPPTPPDPVKPDSTGDGGGVKGGGG